MTHIITSNCTVCGACYDECPTEAVVPGSPQYSIDPEFCNDCALCTDVCPVEAIITD